MGRLADKKFKVREGGRRGFAKGCSTRGRVELHAGARALPGSGGTHRKRSNILESRPLARFLAATNAAGMVCV